MFVYEGYIVICPPQKNKNWKKKKRNGEPDTRNKNIQPGYWNGICHRKICHAAKENLEKIKQWKRKNYQIRKALGHLGKRETLSNWEYWKRTPSNKQTWN